MSAVNTLATQVSAQVENFLAENPSAVLIEDGQSIFDFSSAQYSVSPEHEKCVLQVWSDERNIVRRVVGTEIKNDILRIQVLRFGQAKPALLELCASGDRRTASAKKIIRTQYKTLLARILDREFTGWTLNRITTASDLEFSFGPAHVRAALKLGRRYFAVIGVSSAELQSTVDTSISTAVLWLEYLRNQLADKGHVEGCAIFAPPAMTDVLRLRVANLNHAAAKWRVFTIDERAERANELDIFDIGNVATRLVRHVSTEGTLERFTASTDTIRALMPQAASVPVSTSEISYRLHGLQFARAVYGAAGFKAQQTIFFGIGPAQTELTEDSRPLFEALVARLLDGRNRRDRHDPLYRRSSERWLESIVQRDVNLLDERLDNRFVYAQVPAFAATDRAMIDLLTVTRSGRLAAIELKADEDRHLPVQGLDYWARVRWHHQRGEFQSHGYFPGVQLSDEDPLLIMAAPALHLHPSTDTLLRHLGPNVEWSVLGLDEHWRNGIRVVFRKRSSDARPLGASAR